MPRVEFVGQSASDADNRQANTSRLINFYREPVGGTAGHQLKSVLGKETLTTLVPSAGPTLNVRAISEISGKMYVVSGGYLFSVTAGGTATEIGFTRDREPTYLFGAEQISPGVSNVCIVCGGRYFVYDGTTIERPDPVDAPFDGFGSGIYLNGFVVLTEQDGSRFLWTDLADAKAFEGLNFATAESNDKPILQAMKVAGRLWLMKSDIIEVWAQVGSGANAFTRVTGGLIEIGLKDQGLATTFTGGLFWIGADNIVYLSDGQNAPQPISPPAVNTAIDQGNPTNVFYYEDEGHKFCVIRFNDRPAWVYDIVTGEWHERASGEDGAWAVTAIGRFAGTWYAGDTRGKLSKLTRNNVDGTESLIRTAVSSTLYMDGAFFTVPRFEITGRVGEGANEPQPILEEELLSNGTFDVDLSDWEDNSASGGATSWNAGGYAQLVNTSGTARLRQSVATVAGEPYFWAATNNSTATIQFDFTLEDDTQEVIAPGETASGEFVAVDSETKISLKAFQVGTALADDVSFRKIRTIRELHCTDGRVFAEQDAPDPIPAGAVWRTKGRFYREPQIGLELSGDGRTFGEQVTRSFGALGEYERIARFGPLGGHYRLAAKIVLSTERDISLDAMANVEVA